MRCGRIDRQFLNNAANADAQRQRAVADTLQTFILRGTHINAHRLESGFISTAMMLMRRDTRSNSAASRMPRSLNVRR